MKKKVIPYCPKPKNAFERGLFKYFEGKKGQDHKEENQKKKSKKKVRSFFRKNKTGT
ncbi:hypothetical protein VY323_002639 [Enterococcus faecalis]|nr:hypothetical protein [Enterococcus faecalis]